MKYYITYECDVYEYDYENGEGNMVNCWADKFTSNKNTPTEAVEELFEKHLFYKLNKEYLDDDEMVSYPVCVDVNNEEASEEDIEEWKSGKLDLYTNYIRFEIFELKKIDLSETVLEPQVEKKDMQ